MILWTELARLAMVAGLYAVAVPRLIAIGTAEREARKTEPPA
jgi:hypothetical protein